MLTCLCYFCEKASNRRNRVNNSQLSILQNSTDKTPIFTLDSKEFNAKCTKCYDADTVHLVFLYNGQLSRWTCRLEGIDSAEIKSNDEQEREFAIKSRDYLKGLILDKIVTIKCGKFDKYGRLLVTINLDELNINNHLVKNGYAYSYNGKTKKAFREWHN